MLSADGAALCPQGWGFGRLDHVVADRGNSTQPADYEACLNPPTLTTGQFSFTVTGTTGAASDGWSMAGWLFMMGQPRRRSGFLLPVRFELLS